MKMRRILAAASAMAVAATMAVVPASAASSTAYMYTVQPSWSGTSANDLITGGPDNKKGYGDLKDWDSGNAWNGNWIQIELSSDNLDNTSIDFTIDTSAAEWQTEGNDGEAMTEWTVLRVADTGDASPYALIVDDNTKGTYTYTMTSENLKKAIADGKAQLNKNEGETVSYTLGMSFQVGHLGKAKVTGAVNSDVLFGVEDPDSSKPDDSSKTDDDKKPSSSTGDDDKSTDTNSSKTGATTGLALIGVALAGAAIAVSRKRK